MNVAIVCVFIAKENILFMREWIDYHKHIGVSRFYLYDNSKVQRSLGCHGKRNHYNPGHVNKYGVDYDKLVNMSQQQIDEHKQCIVDDNDGDVVFYDWSPVGSTGQIMGGGPYQAQAYNENLQTCKQDGVDWCCAIDMDEFIVLKGVSFKNFLNRLDARISSVKVKDVLFQSRFDNIGNKVTDITSHWTKSGGSRSFKNIYRVKDTSHVNIHKVTTAGKQHVDNAIWLNHYKINKMNVPSHEFVHLDNITNKLPHKH